MTNAEIMAIEKGLDRFSVNKAASPTVPTSGDFAVGDFMDRTQLNRLIDLTVNSSEWLKMVTVLTRNQKKGEIPREILDEVVTEGVPENDMGTVATHPDTSLVQYQTAKFKATTFLTRESLREARAAGEPNFADKVLGAFAKAIGNDMARWALKGDTSLDTSTRLNRLLRQRDGWLKRARNGSAVYGQTTRGSAYAQGLYWYMIQQMPEAYSEDPNLKWILPRALDLQFTADLSAYAAQGSKIGEDSLTQRKRWAPAGIDPVIVPQMPTSQGFDVCSGSTAAADAVTDLSGSIRFQVDAALGGYAASKAGRILKVTLNSTGESEAGLVVADTGSILKIETAGTLGQSTVSTTPGDYTIDLYDLTSIMLTNPRNLFLVLCDQIRAWRKWEQEGERWRIDLFYEADVGIFNENAIVLQDGVITPTQSWGA